MCGEFFWNDESLPDDTDSLLWRVIGSAPFGFLVCIGIPTLILYAIYVGIMLALQTIGIIG